MIRRETGGWKWMWLTFAYMLLLAYAAALLTNQIAGALGPVNLSTRLTPPMAA